MKYMKNVKRLFVDEQEPEKTKTKSQPLVEKVKSIIKK